MNDIFQNNLLITTGSQEAGHTMKMSDYLRENGISHDKISIIDPEMEFDLLSPRIRPDSRILDDIIGKSQSENEDTKD